MNDAPRFSADLQTWRPATAAPVVLASDGVMEAVAIPFPSAAGKGGDGVVDDDSPGVGGGDRDGHEGGSEGAYRFFRLVVTLEP